MRDPLSFGRIASEMPHAVNVRASIPLTSSRRSRARKTDDRAGARRVILRRTLGPDATGIRVLSRADEARRRLRTRYAIAVDLDRRLASLGYESPGN